MEETELISVCEAICSTQSMHSDQVTSDCSRIGKLHAGCLPVNALEAPQGGSMLVEGQPSLRASPVQAREAVPALAIHLSHIVGTSYSKATGRQLQLQACQAR